MNEIREIQERLERGDQRFGELTQAMSDIKAHLGRQDETMACLTTKIDRVVQGTEDVVTMWNGGVQAVRFFCRLAEGWRFFLRQFMVPVVLPLLVVYGGWIFVTHGHLPTWMQAVIKIIEAF